MCTTIFEVLGSEERMAARSLCKVLFGLKYLKETIDDKNQSGIRGIFEICHGPSLNNGIQSTDSLGKNEALVRF